VRGSRLNSFHTDLPLLTLFWLLPRPEKNRGSEYRVTLGFPPSSGIGRSLPRLRFLCNLHAHSWGVFSKRAGFLTPLEPSAPASGSSQKGSFDAATNLSHFPTESIISDLLPTIMMPFPATLFQETGRTPPIRSPCLLFPFPLNE